MKSRAPASRPGDRNYFGRPMPVPILKQGAFLIASVQAALTDSDTERLRYDLMERVSRFRAQGIIVDVTAIDVMDSFAARSLRTIAHMTRLRGAETVIVGLQPEVAFAMVQLGLAFDDMNTALDLEEGVALLNRQLGWRKSTIGRDGGG
jgi:rsbT antagonist protein RsbS